MNRSNQTRPGKLCGRMRSMWGTTWVWVFVVGRDGVTRSA
jgi:hypothetical protein